MSLNFKSLAAPAALCYGPCLNTRRRKLPRNMGERGQQRKLLHRFRTHDQLQGWIWPMEGRRKLWSPRSARPCGGISRSRVEDPGPYQVACRKNLSL